MFKGAQIWSRPSRPGNIKIIQQKTVDVKTVLVRHMTDIVSLRDGHVILINNLGTSDNGELLLFDLNLEFKKRLPNSGRPWGITQIDIDTIAVSYPNEQSIKLISLSTEQVKGTVKLSEKGYGVAFKHEEIVIGGYKNFQIINFEGAFVEKNSVQTESRLSYIVCVDEKVVYSDPEANSVHCVDSSGNEIWRIVNDYIKRPHGICADDHGNIFIACTESNSIVVISADGRKSHVLVGSDNVTQPTVIALNKQDSSLIVCHTKFKKLTKLKLSHA